MFRLDRMLDSYLKSTPGYNIYNKKIDYTGKVRIVDIQKDNQEIAQRLKKISYSPVTRQQVDMYTVKYPDYLKKEAEKLVKIDYKVVKPDFNVGGGSEQEALVKESKEAPEAQKKSKEKSESEAGSSDSITVQPEKEAVTKNEVPFEPEEITQEEYNVTNLDIGYLPMIKLKSRALLSLAQSSSVDMRPVIIKANKGKAGLYIEVKSSEERDLVIKNIKTMTKGMANTQYKRLLNEMAKPTKFVISKAESMSESETGSWGDDESTSESENEKKSSKSSKASKASKASRAMARELVGGGSST